MIVRRTLVPLVTAAAIAASPMCAHAQGQSNAPPGNAAVDEYLETIPAASGGTPSGSVKPGANGGRLPTSTSQVLGDAGQSGGRLVEFTEATGVPKRARPVHNGGNSGSSAGPSTIHDAASKVSPTGSEPVISVVDRSLTGKDGDAGGLGVGLPILLGLIAIIGVALAMRRPGPA